MKKEQCKDKKPCTRLTEQAMENLARLIISELENTDISRGVRSTNYAVKGNETPLYLILHYADLWSSRVTEGSTDEGSEE